MVANEKQNAYSRSKIARNCFAGHHVNSRSDREQGCDDIAEKVAGMDAMISHLLHE